MAERKTVEYWNGRGLLLLAISLLVGVVAWGLSLEIEYALVKWACRRQQSCILAAVPSAGFAIVMAAAGIGWSCVAKARTVADEGGGRLVDSSYLVAQMAVGLNLLLALMILTWVVLPFMVSPCE